MTMAAAAIDGTRPQVLIWGTYDLGKPRTRLLLQALRASDAEVTEIHAPVWEGIEDKAVMGKLSVLKRALSWLAAYPWLLWRLMRTPRPDVILIAYLGQLDVLFVWPIARFRRIPVVWDAFLSLHDTLVADRRMISRYNPLAGLLWLWEWLACRAATRVVLDTEAQAALFRKSYRLAPQKVTSVFVGAEGAAFPVLPARDQTGRATVLFYGQFIPLHGIATIVEAARLSADKPIDWVIIGTGQLAREIRNSLADDPADALSWEEWLPYDELTQRIAAADVCLGVFGTSDKAGRVIPNKVFQILSSGRPLITRDGPGIRELVPDDALGIELIPPADPATLVEAVERLIAQGPFPPDLHADLRARFSVPALTEQWERILKETITP